MIKKLLLIVCSALIVTSLYANVRTMQKTEMLTKTNQEQIQDMQELRCELDYTLSQIEDQIDYLDVIYKTSEKYDLEPELVLALMKVESNFQTDAKNGRCYGLMQVSDIHTTEDLLDLRTNVDVGSSLLSDLIDDREDIHEALGCYNRGVKGYETYKKSHNKITSYSNKIVTLMNELKGENNV